MLAYLEVVKKLVQPEIYDRGVRLYLEGKVLNHQSLILDYWRKYEVQGRNEVYTIQLPLLHLALDQAKFAQAHTALVETVRCDCTYFQEFGVCVHIVAVAAALDQEFKINSNFVKTRAKPVEGVWDKIIQAETTKREREWQIALEYCLYNDIRESSRHFKLLKEMLAQVVDNPKVSFPVGMRNMFEAIAGDYMLEKNMLKLFVHSYFLSKGGLTWWQTISPWFEKMDKDNQLKLIQELWKNHLVGNTKAFDERLAAYLSDLSQGLKDQSLSVLQEQLRQEPSQWLEFALVSKNLLWLEKNLDYLDGSYLVAVAEMLPDKRDELEMKLGQQARIWSDFLQPGQYQELLDLLNLWKNRLGRSEHFEEVLQYIRQNHPKKTKLIGGLEKLG